MICILDLRQVGRRIPTADGWLIRDVSMELSPSERVIVSGPSGSGKSVLLRVIAMLDPFEAGDIRWNGELVTDSEVPQFRSRVIYLHQRTPMFDGTVSDNLRMPFQLQQHQGRKYDEQMILGWLEVVDRDLSFLDRRTADLSGGERQIVSLLRAIQLKPQVLLLDEPTSAADQRTVASIERVVLNWLEQETNHALIWVTHDSAQAERMGQRELQMDRGRIAEVTSK
ncbi:MAG: ATP-binding cassette domain-containing protein [Pirellulaceae bacterium]|nr:ATP-binding cassette domain-containing protein [Pirellulaceae bacterium]